MCIINKLSKTLIALFVLLSLIISSTSVLASEIVGRLSVHWSPKHHSAKHAQIFADEVNKRAKGKLKIEVYPSKQLFGIREVMGAVTSGAVELGGIVGVVSFPPINKNFNVASFPGLFNSWEQQRGFFQNSPKGKEIWGELTKKTNSTLIMYNPVGPVMSISSARELTGIDAMKGLKARRLLKSEEPMWDALGANRVSLKTGEVYNALQSGMIDTINSPPGSIKAYSWWEFLKYAQKPYQYYADAYIMANSTWFNGLPADLQKIIMDVGKEVGTLSTDRIMDHGETVLKEFQDRGGVVTTLSGAEKAKFDKLMKEKVMPAMAKMIDSDALVAAQEYAKNNYNKLLAYSKKMKALRAINNLFASASMMLAMLIIFIMVAALFLSATTRFITGTGFAWFIELPPVLVSWLVFPLLGPLLKRGQHIKVDFLTPILSEKFKKILFLAVNLVAFISACVFFKAGLDATIMYYNLGQVMEIEISIPIWWMFLAFPVGFLILALTALELMFDNILNLINK